MLFLVMERAVFNVRDSSLESSVFNRWFNKLIQVPTMSISRWLWSKCVTLIHIHGLDYLLVRF